MSERIGFVGVGRMGANIAHRLKERGCHVAAVYDAQPSAAARLAEEIGAGRVPGVVKRGGWMAA